MTKAAGLTEELSELGQTVAEARAQLAGGHMIDMSTFEARLEDVCRRLEADGTGAREHLAILGALRADLEALAEEIQGRLAALRAMSQEPAGTPDPKAPPAGSRRG